MIGLTRACFGLRTLVCVPLVLLAHIAHADTVAIKVGYSAGGTYDAYARLVARHLPRHLDGNPDVIVQNVPGAGSMKLARMLLGSEPGDGTVIGMINASMATAPILDAKAEDLDVAGFRWVGALATQPSLCVVSTKSGISGIEDLAKSDIILGATGKSSHTYIFAAAVKKLLDANYRIVAGFDGGADINAAILRGEIQGRCGTSLSAYTSRMDPDLFDVVLQIALEVPEATKEIPSILDQLTDPIDREALAIVASSLQVDRPLVLPADTPDDVLAAYRAAFQALVTDPEFLAEAAAQQLIIDPTPGDQVAQIVDRVAQSSAQARSRARDLVQ